MSRKTKGPIEPKLPSPAPPGKSTVDQARAGEATLVLGGDDQRRSQGRRETDREPPPAEAQPVAKVKPDKVSVYLEPDTALALKMQALREKRSASALVQEVVAAYLRMRGALE